VKVLAAATSALLMLHGCALMSPAQPQPAKHMLSKMPPQLPQRGAHAASLLVFPPKTRPVYDTTRIAYTLQDHEIAYFSRHEWGETPSQMLRPLLEGTLRQTQYFSAVLTPPYAGRYGYALRTEVREFVADFRSEPPALRFSLRFELSEGATDRVLVVKEISVHESIPANTPQASVAAANDAVAKALLELASLVLDNAH
jgi:cholesterol transport system auxiliary component